MNRKKAPIIQESPINTDFSVDIRLLRLLQMCSPTLPVGAFSYSQGMEWAVSAGWIREAEDVRQWIEGLLHHSLARLDVPVILRMVLAWQQKDPKRLAFWNNYLLASRASSEMLAQDKNMGLALARLLTRLGIIEAGRIPQPVPSFAVMFAAAAAGWQIPVEQSCAGLLWSWADNQVAAALKLVSLGQTEGQRIMTHIGAEIPGAVAYGLSLPDEAIGAGTIGLAIASSLHETQHTRLFRS